MINTENLDVQNLIDRLATRFGAFAIVGTVTLPLQQIAQGLIAVRSALGEDTHSFIPTFEFWIMVVLGGSFSALSLMLMMSIIAPLFQLMKIGAWWHGVLWVVFGTVACFSLIGFMVVVMMTDQIKAANLATLPEIQKVLDTCQEAEGLNIPCIDHLSN